MKISSFIGFLQRSLMHLEYRIVQAASLDRQLAPAVAVQGPGLLKLPQSESAEWGQSTLLDSILWMAAPKKRRTIEVNRCRRRNEHKLIPVKNNIVPCPECGHLKQKHILCGFCYERVRRETALIRGQIQAMEGGPLKNPAVETVVLYESENPGEADGAKRTVETKRKRPTWFNLTS
ncbi:39S ribosomal protein L32, mitochondrial isoform X1 [Brienomyrus brachyistius]|uniref:39S ribosomal protein L32, mitochondrial isoform X1 n=1 Tax=Brienomyrus brachyistius TaxID=42636 RepID=UPI0020B2866E|nr:39S ribosomal protein L32, mitochondrial isoform X1 [Brienomyrus brachyistius]